ncbi:MAG: hypothetical protein ACE5RJ_00300 [Nitrosopumilaceae archaeon]
MAKESMILAVSVLTLFVAAFAAYSISGLELTSSPQTATAEIIDYTDEFQAIQSTLQEVSQKLATLESDTVKELEIIRTELENVKSIKSEAKQDIITTTKPFSIALNKLTYHKGDAIVVSSNNALPQKSVTIQLLSSFNELIVSKNAFSDSTGGFVFTFPIPEFVSPGDYKIKATSESGTDTMLITISDDSTHKESTTPTITSVSALLDKEEYKPGDLIKVTGNGLASTPILAELTSPDNEKSTANASTASDGTYTLIFILDSDAKQGNWKIKVTQEDLVQTVTFEVDN